MSDSTSTPPPGELVPAANPPPQAEISLFDGSPADVVRRASDIAGTLAEIVERKRLFTLVRGRKHVHVSGWTTAAAMIGVVAREVEVIEHDDGVFEATVELVRVADGQVIGRGSSMCGPDESTWKNRPRYARRSMAVTRACGRACRLALSWIMELAGYDPTPREEIDEPLTQRTSGVVIDVDDGQHEVHASKVPATAEQQKQIKSLAKRCGLRKEEAQAAVEKFGAKKLSDLTVARADALIADFELKLTQTEAPF